MDSLRILLTNNTLRLRSGSELVLLELATRFKKLGHFPVAYSTDLGPIADELRKNCVPVLDDLSSPGFVPDVIHGHHHLDTMVAMLRFPDTPAVCLCQGWVPPEEGVPVFPNVMRYVAVSELTAERVRTTNGVDSRRLRIIPNAVDLGRFRRREIPLALKSAAVFSNAVGAGPFLDLIRAACRRAGVEKVDVIGARAGTSVAHPEEVLPRYDVIFAIGRSAIEAIASGCAVVVASPDGLAGMVDADNVSEWSRHNFALAVLDRARLTEAELTGILTGYRAQSVSQACEHLRARQGLDRISETYLALYREAIEEWKAAGPVDSALRDRQWRSASSYLAGLSVVLKRTNGLRKQSSESSARLAQLRHETVQAKKELDGVQARLVRMLGPADS